MNLARKIFAITILIGAAVLFWYAVNNESGGRLYYSIGASITLAFAGACMLAGWKQFKDFLASFPWFV